MGYNLDLSVLTVREYKNLLKNQNLLPGRRLLWQNIDHHFDAVLKQDVVSVAELKKRLSSPPKISAFASATGVPEDYLILLKREIGSLEQKPVPIESFPDINDALISTLNGMGLTNSKLVFESGSIFSDELFCLCDLVRINGVGPVAARAFYEAGYRTVSDVACADAAVMLERVSKTNETKQYYKAKLGVKDMQFCIDFAALLTKLP